MAPAEIWLVEILLGGLMGMLGQGLRVVVGLKKAQEFAQQQGASLAETFETSTLLVSLLIGFTAGAVATLTLGTDGQGRSSEQLLGLMAAGYAGTDFIEGFVRKYMPGQASGQAAPPLAAAAVSGGAGGQQDDRQPPPAVG